MAAEEITELEPDTWYKVTCRCNTETCVNGRNQTVFTIDPFYSNNGTYIPVQCGLCGQLMELLTAVKLDPQPPRE